MGREGTEWGMRRILVRWGIALVAVACGWGVDFLVYLSIAAASAGDRYAWAVWTGLFCGAAWFLVGLPLAVVGPDLSSRGRVAVATVLCGAAGMVLIGGLFRSVEAMVSIFGLLAFVAGAASMLVYAGLCRMIVFVDGR